MKLYVPKIIEVAMQYGCSEIRPANFDAKTKDKLKQTIFNDTLMAAKMSPFDTETNYLHKCLNNISKDCKIMKITTLIF